MSEKKEYLQGFDPSMLWHDATSKLQEMYRDVKDGNPVPPQAVELLKIQAILSVAQEISDANVHNHLVNNGEKLVPQATVITVSK